MIYLRPPLCFEPVKFFATGRALRPMLPRSMRAEPERASRDPALPTTSAAAALPTNASNFSYRLVCFHRYLQELCNRYCCIYNK